jgi:hypothetical protein
LGTAGNKIGHAHLTWAFAEAAPLFLRTNPEGQKLRARLENKHDKGKALRILAQKLGRAVSYMRKRHTAFEMRLFLQASGSRARAPDAALDVKGLRLTCAHPVINATASWNAIVRLGLDALRPTR